MKFASFPFAGPLTFGIASVLASGNVGCSSDSVSPTTATTSTGTSTSDGGSSGTHTTSSSTHMTSSTGTSSGGAGGAGGSNPDFIDAPDDTWTFVPVDGSVCMNNTATGIGINKVSDSEDVVIYMEGGNACFNAVSCSITYNLNGYGPTEFAGDVSSVLADPLFDRSTSILKDYNFVYVPYCTGDTHAGHNDTIVGGTMRHFHGADNMDLYLKRLVATFPKAKHVIVSGSSAGGFGAAFNYDRVAKAFGAGVDVKLLDDSGPPLSVEYVSACLQKSFVDTWGLASTLPADCTDCVGSDGVFMEPLVKYIETKYASNRLAIISSSEDGTISKFWGYGEDEDGTPDCSMIGTTSSTPTFPATYDGTRYAAGLQDLRDRIIGSAQTNFRMFIIDGTAPAGSGPDTDNTHHVWLDEDPTAVQSNGTNLGVFLTEMLDPNSTTWVSVPTTGI